LQKKKYYELQKIVTTLKGLNPISKRIMLIGFKLSVLAFCLGTGVIIYLHQSSSLNIDLIKSFETLTRSVCGLTAEFILVPIIYDYIRS